MGAGFRGPGGIGLQGGPVPEGGDLVRAGGGPSEVSLLVRVCNFRHTFLPQGQDSLSVHSREPLLFGSIFAHGQGFTERGLR